ncbi:MAG: hypothetical protein M1528_02445 [Candidatus Marsarchaeota archaeon]|jgi:hypothetical protein|nr:hypothetical protein [Candidatus Marsarchaeota archaeon]MCL5115368.1 hypothetical protein [Candidatus Marsarchaeota archaeon]
MPLYSRSRSVDISISQFSDIYDRLGAAFGEPVTVIGGRAVNLLCFHNKRDTNDIDVVISPVKFSRESLRNPEFYSHVRERLIENGFVVDSSSAPLGKIVDMESGIRIDLYFSRDISGVPISDIIEGSTEISLPVGKKTANIRVASPVHLIIMKYNTFISDGKGSGGRQGKDGADMRNIISNHYRTPENFLNVEGAKLAEYFMHNPEAMKAFANILLLVSYGIHSRQ